MKLTDLPQHHAVLIVREDREIVASNLWSELSALSPSHVFFNQTVLDIENVRKLISFANSSHQGKKTALISFHSATLPAQNAMLKILEEPRVGVSFILVTSNKSLLIPTVLSRVCEFKQTTDSRHQTIGDAEEFLNTKPTERMKLKFIAELLNKEDEEGRKDREVVGNFILSLIDVCKNKKEIKGETLIKLTEMFSYSSDPSASGKSILEFISLLLPVTSN